MGGLFRELKRRNVYKVATVYVVTSWLLLQVADTLFPAFEFPDTAIRIPAIALLLGFPLVLLIAWVFELTPQGIVKTQAASQEVTVEIRNRDYFFVAMLLMLIGVVSAQQFVILSKPMDQASTLAEKSIAVLPFVNMSDDEENEYFADGISLEIINRLAQLPELLVTARFSSFKFKGQNKDLQEIGYSLGVAYLLDGSVRRQGDDVRVTAELIRREDGASLWSNTYNRTLDNVFSVQDDISESVARAMDVVLDEDKRAQMRAAGVRNVDAFVAYQKGLELYDLAHGRGEQLPDLLRANEYFDDAIRLVPNFGQAYYWKSDYYFHVLDFPDSSLERADTLTRYRAALDVAFENTRNSQRKAFIDVDRTLYSDDWRQLGNRIQRAIAEPGCNSPNALALLLGGWSPEDVSDVYRRASECDPLRVILLRNWARGMVFAGNPDGALEILDAASEQIGNQVIMARVIALTAMGRFSEARESVASEDEQLMRPLSIMVEAAAGNLEEAQRLAVAWLDSGGHSDRLEVVVLAQLGDRDGANTVATRIDGEPGGAALLMWASSTCTCGAPFDIEATPNFQKQLEESGLSWPPASPIEFPAKDW